MNENNNSNAFNNSNTLNGSNNSIPWSTKAKYLGAGIVIGAMVSPLLRKTLSKVQPKIDELFDNLTGKTEEVAEKASDLFARAKEHLRGSDVEVAQDHSSHSHANGESKQERSFTQEL